MRSTTLHDFSHPVARSDMSTDLWGETFSKTTLELCINLPLAEEVVDGWVGGMVGNSGDMSADACVISPDVGLVLVEPVRFAIGSTGDVCDTTLLIAGVLINMRIAEFVGTLASVVSDTGVDVFAGVDVDTQGIVVTA